jgi:hypothetical protein
MVTEWGGRQKKDGNTKKKTQKFSLLNIRYRLGVDVR